MNEIEKRNAKLPAKIEDLQKYILVGRQVLKAHVAKLKAIMAVEDGQVAHQAALEDTQDMGEILLYAEAKLGALIPPRVYVGTGEGTNIGKSQKPSLPPGVNKKQSHYAQELNRHQDIIAEVVAEAREKGEIPVRQHVLKVIQANKPKPAIVPAEIKSGKMRTVIIDPPWPYETHYNAETRRVASPYPEMSIEGIIQTEFPFADDCILWLWTTHKFLSDSFDILMQWGFDYKATLVWDKSKMGIGYWLRMQCEFCLLATQGKPTWEATNIRDIITEGRREHSRKPESFYKMVLENCPKPIGEAFSRQNRDGITIITGNETGKFNE